MSIKLRNIISQLGKLKLLSFEKVVIIYIILTSFIIIFNHKFLDNFESLLQFRIEFLLLIFGFVTLSAFFKSKYIVFIRYVIVSLSIIYWYPETFEINRIFNNLDYKMAGIEQWIFGFQPALLLHNYFKIQFIDELIHFGYFAYYPIIVFVGFYILYADNKKIERYVYFLTFSFFSFYLLYICFPTAGPQYYFPAIGVENVQAGVFPNIYQYFNHNSNLTIAENSNGFFYSLVEYSQQIGERPTAAFPSSHVGITTVIILFLYFNRHFKAFWIILPVYMLLVFSTVYIQAHYVIDVVAGLVSAYILYYLSEITFPLFARRFKLETLEFEKIEMNVLIKKKLQNQPE